MKAHQKKVSSPRYPNTRESKKYEGRGGYPRSRSPFWICLNSQRASEEVNSILNHEKVKTEMVINKKEVVWLYPKTMNRGVVIFEYR